MDGESGSLEMAVIRFLVYVLWLVNERLRESLYEGEVIVHSFGNICDGPGANVKMQAMDRRILENPKK